MVLVVVLFQTTGIAQELQAAQRAQAEKAADVRFEKLNQQVTFEETQKPLVRQLLVQGKIQESMDRITYKNNALALINAAWNRERNIDRKMEDILTSEQKEKYMETRRMDPVSRELFTLTEGLLLTDEQAFDAEGILINIHNEFKPLKEITEGEGGGEGMPPGPPPDSGEFEPHGGGAPPMGMGGGRGMGGGMGMGPGPMGGRDNPFKTMEAKKEKAIKKILTKEQKELYDQILKEKKVKMDKMNEQRGKRAPHREWTSSE